MNQAHQHLKNSDWRKALAVNRRKTFMVIGLFVLIYIAIGFLADLYIHGAFDQGQFQLVFHALFSLQILPMATITMGVVAILSLWITYALHDRIMLLGTDYHEVTAENALSLEEQQLYNTAEEMKIAAGLRYMPKVYIINADYMNAFASGYSEKSAMIAITRGLLQKLNRSELQAVMAHELNHIRHGDIKLTLTAAVLSNLMLIAVDFLFYNAVFGGKRNEGNDNKFLAIIILIRYLLPLVTVLLMLFLSRTREYMADAGCVELMRDNDPLGRALTKISTDHQANAETYRKEYGKTQNEDVRRAAYIFDPFSAGIHSVKSVESLFSTHPSLEERLNAIGFHSTITS